MGWVSGDRQRELDRLARYEQDLGKLEKSNQKERDALRQDYNDRLEDQQLTDAAEQRKIQRQLDRVTAEKKEAETVTREKTEATFNKQLSEKDKEISTLNTQIEDLDSQIEVYADRVTTEADLLKREIKLTADRASLDADIAANEARGKDLTAREKKLTDREASTDDYKYKSGYADGVSDTLREGQELANTANERVFKLAEKAVEPRSASTVEPNVTINATK